MTEPAPAHIEGDAPMSYRCDSLTDMTDQETTMTPPRVTTVRSLVIRDDAPAVLAAMVQMCNVSSAGQVNRP